MGKVKKRQVSGDGRFERGLTLLAGWFERHRRILPWRDDPSLYRVWISEIMLQQTQVATVVPYFERFMEKFPSVQALARAREDDVLLSWAGLGYYSRARNLHRAARVIVGERGGKFPRTREGWLEIPGVGEYTAGAILSIALDQPEAILDGNVERVLSRVRRVSRARGDSEYKARLWRLSRAFVEHAPGKGIRPSVLNQALMELGATVCTPRGPVCHLCPLAELCQSRAAGQQEEYPPRKKPKKWLQVREELHCLLDPEGKVLLRQRQGGEWRAGLWDLPSEAPRVGGARQIGSIETKHVVTRHKITRVTHVWRMRSGKWSAAEGGARSELRWVDPSKPGVAVGSALRRTLQEVRERFESEV